MMVRLLLISLAVLGIWSTRAYSEEPSLANCIHHLKNAAHHLHQAGLDHEAKELELRVDEILQECRVRLEQNRQSLRQLQMEQEVLLSLLKPHQPVTYPSPQVSNSLPQPKLLQPALPEGVPRLASPLRDEQVQYRMKCVIAEVNPQGMAKIEALTEHQSENSPSASQFRYCKISTSDFARLKRELQSEWNDLSRPTLMVLSGSKASVHIGQHLPIMMPVSGQVGQMKVNYHEAGIKLDVVASKLTDSRISLEISPEITKPVKSGVQVAGHEVPGFHVVKCVLNTEVDLGKTLLLHQVSRNGVSPIVIAIMPERSEDQNQPQNP